MNYSTLIEQHFRYPQNVGSLENPEACIIAVGAIDVGYYLQLSVLLTDSQLITQVNYQAYGCPVLIAIGSWLTTWLIGKSIKEGLTLTESTLNDALSVPANKRYLAALAVTAITKLHEQYNLS